MKSMHQKYLTKTFVLLFSVVALVMSVPVRAADDKDDEAIDQKFIRGVLEGLGLERDHKPIDYHERSPLVVPPTRDLPPPEQAEAVANNNPAWPKDPDVTRRKEEKRLERERSNVSAEEQFEEGRRPLRPDQLTPGGDPKTKPSGSTIAQSPGENNQRLTPSQLGYKGGIFSSLFGGNNDEETAKFTGEPTRGSLTEPPTGYRTPSPDQPYGVGKAAAPTKASDNFTTHGEMKP